MTNDYKPGDRIRASIEAEVSSLGADGLWVTYDEATYNRNCVGLSTYVPYAAITEKIEPPAPAWIEGDIVYGKNSKKLFERSAVGEWASGAERPMYVDLEVTRWVAEGAIRAIVRGGEIVR